MKLSNQKLLLITEVILLCMSLQAFAGFGVNCNPAGSNNCFLDNSDSPISEVALLQNMVDGFRTDPGQNAPSDPQITEMKNLLKNSLDALSALPGSYIDSIPGSISDFHAIPAENLAMLMAEVLIEPNHTGNFTNLFAGKPFYQSMSNTGSTPPSNAEAISLSSLTPAGGFCSSFTPRKCEGGLPCIQNSEPQETGCFPNNNVCTNDSACCSNKCNNGVCVEDNVCSAVMIEGVEFTDPNLNCKDGLTKKQFTEGNSNYYMCVDDNIVGDPDVTGDFRMHPQTCAPIISTELLERFDQNERMLMAFEYVFSKSTGYDDHYNHLSKIRQAASAFGQARINTKRSYEQSLNQIYASFEQMQAAVSAASGSSGTVGEYELFDFYVQEQNAIYQKEKSRTTAYDGIKPQLDEFIKSVQKGPWKSWGKKKWFKKNKCGKYSIPFLRSKNHKKCAKKKANVSGGEIGPNIESFLRVADKSETQAGSCIMDPAMPDGVMPSGSVSSMKSSIQGRVQAYADTPIGNGSGTSGIQIPDRTINYVKESYLINRDGDYEQGDVDVIGALSKIVAKTMLTYGNTSNCRNPAKSKIQYAMAVKDAIDEVQNFYRESSKLREKMISCLETRRDQYAQLCDPTLPESEGGCLAPDTTSVNLVDGCQEGETGEDCEGISNVQVINDFCEGENCPATEDEIVEPEAFESNGVLGFNGNIPGDGSTTISGGKTKSSSGVGSDAGLKQAAVTGGNSAQGAFGKVNGNSKEGSDSGINGNDSSNSNSSDKFPGKNESDFNLNGNNRLGANGVGRNGSIDGSLGGSGNIAQGGIGGAGSENENQLNKNNENTGKGFTSINSGRNAKGRNSIFGPDGNFVGDDNYDYSEGQTGTLGGSFASDSTDANMIERNAKSAKNKASESDGLFTRVSKAYNREALPVFLIRPEEKNAQNDIQFQRTPSSQLKKKEEKDKWKDF